MGVEASSSPKSTASLLSGSGDDNVLPLKETTQALLAPPAIRPTTPSSSSYGIGTRRRSLSLGTEASVHTGLSDDWGFFVENSEPPTPNAKSPAGSFDDADDGRRALTRALSLPPPVTQPPQYILESKLSTQQLWYSTAGKRPRQPTQERQYYESLWRKNFEVSCVRPPSTTPLPSAPSSSSGSSGRALASGVDVVSSKGNGLPTQEEVPSCKECDGEILFRGKGPFSNAVSKSFPDSDDVAAMTLQIPRYRVTRTPSGDVHAEFLVVVSVNSRSAVTFGLWRRHSDFTVLAAKVKGLDAASDRPNTSFKNTLLSWQCLVQRKRWFRCLDKDYLALKSFLLERFMHDLLFESHTPDIVMEFLDLA